MINSINSDVLLTELKKIIAQAGAMIMDNYHQNRPGWRFAKYTTKYSL